MSARQDHPFRIIRGTTAPSFKAGSSAVFASTTSAFQSTALSRVWSGGSGRTVRIAEDKGIDAYINFGTSDVTVGGSTDAMLFLGGTVEVFHIEPNQTHIAVLSVSTSTGAALNVTLGHGG